MLYRIEGENWGKIEKGKNSADVDGRTFHEGDTLWVSVPEFITVIQSKYLAMGHGHGHNCSQFAVL